MLGVPSPAAAGLGAAVGSIAPEPFGLLVSWIAAASSSDPDG